MRHHQQKATESHSQRGKVTREKKFDNSHNYLQEEATLLASPFITAGGKKIIQRQRNDIV
jgi:hypothetical protein